MWRNFIRPDANSGTSAASFYTETGMARPTLTVVGGEREPDTEAIEIIAHAAERMTAAVKSGGAFWLVTDVEGEVGVSYYGGKLESSALAEEIARDAKCSALGLGE